jgi:hypothetical protein
VINNAVLSTNTKMELSVSEKISGHTVDSPICGWLALKRWSAVMNLRLLLKFNTFKHKACELSSPDVQGCLWGTPDVMLPLFTSENQVGSSHPSSQLEFGKESEPVSLVP